MKTTDEERALTGAIRAFTVEAPDGKANGDVERALELLGQALNRNDLGGAREAFATMCDAFADQIAALREAADEYFGGDFEKPA